MAMTFLNEVETLFCEEGFDLNFVNQEGAQLRFRSNTSLSFPASDVHNVHKEINDIIVTCQFMGLYGVDSPLPGYFNQYCLHENYGQVVRGLLDMLSNRSYQLYYLAWQTLRPEILRNNTCKDFFELLQSLTGRGSSSLCFSLAHSSVFCTKLGFITSLKHFFSEATIGVQEFIPQWIPIHTPTQIGKDVVLGQTTALGDRMLGVNGLIYINCFNLSLSRVIQWLLDKGAIQHVLKFIQSYLDVGVEFELRLYVTIKEPTLILGQDELILGRIAWLGHWQANDYLVSLPQRTALSMSNG